MWNLSAWREDFVNREERICIHGKLCFVNNFPE